MDKITGRVKEQEILNKIINSRESEFVAFMDVDEWVKRS